MVKRSRTTTNRWGIARLGLFLATSCFFQQHEGYSFHIPTPIHAHRSSSTRLNSAPPRATEDTNEKKGNPILRWLAQLSLEDYEWRSEIFKANAADRMLEESLARMRGENASYVRPMDAKFPGPLGLWERDSVAWLFSVIEEEARRAKRIVDNAGRLIRPLEIEDGEMLGPLGYLEKQVVEFFAKIRKAERERVRTKTLRPKDLEAAFRGPLGELELETVRIFEEIRESERERGQQIRARGGELVRPIDIPGPLGELELKVAEVFEAEKRRSQERSRRETVVRPKDASFQGPLGKAELEAYDTFKSLSTEEMERLRNIRQFLIERRPMDTNSDSLLGLAESILVGILRAPRVVMGVFERVTELLNSETLTYNATLLAIDESPSSKQTPPTQNREGFE